MFKFSTKLKKVIIIYNHKWAQFRDKYFWMKQKMFYSSLVLRKWFAFKFKRGLFKADGVVTTVGVE